MLIDHTPKTNHNARKIVGWVNMLIKMYLREFRLSSIYNHLLSSSLYPVAAAMSVSFIIITQSYNVLLFEKFHKKHRNLHISTESVTFAIWLSIFTNQ